MERVGILSEMSRSGHPCRSCWGISARSPMVASHDGEPFRVYEEQIGQNRPDHRRDACVTSNCTRSEKVPPCRHKTS